MIALLVGLLAAGGPLLRGSWDLWSQSIFLLAVTAGFGAWVCGRLAAGFVPLPSRRLLAWLAALGVLGYLSSRLSPLAVYAVPQWRPYAAGLWIFLAASALSKDSRAAIDQAIRAAAWTLLLLAVYQKFGQGIARPPASLINQNVFAATILMLLPIAAQKKDWMLTGGLLLAMLWTKSVGAWLGLSAALFLTRRQTGWIGTWVGLGIGIFCLAAIYGKFGSPAVLHRLEWWDAALRMTWDHPWLGSGAGSFQYLLPAYSGQGEFRSLYAHQHILQTSVAFGIPYTLLWLGGLIHCLRSTGSPHKRFAVMALLIHSFWDYPLSMPGNFWLFCYLASSTIPESRSGVNIPLRYKLPAGLAAVGVAAGLCGVIGGTWQADRLKESSKRSLGRGARENINEGAQSLRAASALADDPEIGKLELVEALRRDPDRSSQRGRLLSAAASLEESARLDPYRGSTWTGLERLYNDLGLKELAQAKRKEGAAFIRFRNRAGAPGGS